MGAGTSKTDVSKTDVIQVRLAAKLKTLAETSREAGNVIASNVKAIAQPGRKASIGVSDAHSGYTAMVLKDPPKNIFGPGHVLSPDT